MLNRHAHLFADIGGDDLIVAGQDFDIHVQLGQALEGFGGRVLGWVEESHEAKQGQT